MKKNTILLFLFFSFFLVVLSIGQGKEINQDKNRNINSNQEPLAEKHFIALPLGSVRPEGWLRTQLEIQANGLTGYLDEFWPDLKISKWRGNDKGEGWERGPYYLDGLVPLAWLLDDQRLKNKAMVFIDYILKSGKPDGNFGPGTNTWANSIALKVLSQYHEATNDEKVIPLMSNYFHYLHRSQPQWPVATWHGMRAMETVLSGYWLYNRTKDPLILDVVRNIEKNCFNWNDYFTNFPYTTLPVPFNTPQKIHETHVVNIAMALKNAALYYEMTPGEEYKTTAVTEFEILDKYHGQVCGRFSGDEQLSGSSPTQGTELCAVVEEMFSLENLVEVFGNVSFSDRLELLAYNANPGACTPDYRAHQYDQQSNQVLVDISKRHWSNNSDSSNIYGIEPHYGCCTSNMHQGWPKFVSHLWMATPDNGLAIIAYGPCKVTSKVGTPSQEVEIKEITNYPFDGKITIQFKTESQVEFPVRLRIPAWSNGVTVTVGNQNYPTEPGTYTTVKRLWKTGDTIQMNIPMSIRMERRFNNAVSLYYGPLLLSLRIKEKFEVIHKWTPDFVDWKIKPESEWNYGLLLDNQWEKSTQITQNTPSEFPYSNEKAPIVVKMKGRRIPSWKLDSNSAGTTPTSPVVSTEPDEWLDLIPYGCTRLRISEFPEIKTP